MLALLTLLLVEVANAGLLRFGGLLTERFGGDDQHVSFTLQGNQSLLESHAGSNSTTHFYKNALLDHFGGLSDEKHWLQRYYVDSSQWGGEGYPVFLYIGGEGPQGPVSSSLFMYELAVEHKALVLALEHRFYGESRPVEDMSDANLKFLTSHQALGDLARFVEYIKAYDPNVNDAKSSPPLSLPASAQESPFVAFGGSYPGNLAAWFKLKYPSVVIGSVASSAPVFAEYDFAEYGEVVGRALSYPLIGGSDQCYSAVEKAVTTLKTLLDSTTPAGSSDKIPSYLRPCSPIGGPLDLATYEAQIFGAFQGVVQYNLENRPPYVSDLCTAMTDGNDDDDILLRLVKTLKLVYGGVTCMPSSFEKSVAPLQDAQFSQAGCDLSCSSMRQWIYQSCHEFGYFQTTTGDKMNPFAAFDTVTAENAGAAICKAAYNLSASVDYAGPAANAEGLVANTAYGARNLAAHNITAVNGNMDPWHSLGIVNASDPFFNAGDSSSRFPQHVTPSESIVFIDGTAHCRDMYATNVFGQDPEPVSWAHAKIRGNVAAYLA
eukprot:jgi/Bigna1/46144/estExt_Genewise1.C_20198